MNGTLITYNGDEFVLQNDFGNGRVEHAKLPSGYIPLGIKEYGGVIYVAAYNPITNLSQIGSFPSPERLISSDELEIPEIHFTDADFWDNEYETKGFFSEFFKTGSITEDVLRPGDEFLIGLGSTLTNTSLLRLLSHYLVDVNNKVIKKKNLINIRLGLITSDKSIEYIEDSLIRFTFAEDDDYKHQHWMPILADIAPEQLYNLFKTQYEGKDIYNIYKGNSSGNIIIIVELESLEDFSVQRQINVVDTDKFGVNFICSSDNNDSTTDSYNELVKMEGIEVTLEVTNTDSSDPTILPDSIVNNVIKIKKDKTTEEHLSDPENIKDNLVFYLGEFKQKLEGTSDVLKYKIVPYSKYGNYNRYTKKGIIDFKFVNSGIHNLNEFRYYTGNTTSTIAYGLDYYPKEGYSVNEVFMEFYDFTNDISIYHKCRDQDEYSGHFIETIEFVESTNEMLMSKIDDVNNHYYIQKNRSGSNVFISNSDITQLLKNNLYLVRICISENTGINNTSTYTNFYRFLYTTSIFNEQYLSNEILDFEELEITGSLDADVESKLSTKYTNNQDTLGAGVNYSLYYNAEQVEEDTSLFEAKMLGNYSITDKISITPKLENTSTTSIKKYFGTFNKDSIKINNTDTEIINSDYEYSPSLIGDDSTDIRNRINQLLSEYPDYFEDADDPIKITIDGDHGLTLNTNMLINRFIVANKTFNYSSVDSKILQKYLSEEYMKINSLNNIQKRVNGLQLVNIDDTDKPALINSIVIRGDARGDRKSFFYGELLREAYRGPVNGDENVGQLVKEFDYDDNYYYRHALMVYRSTAYESSLNDYESSNPFNQGLHKILSIYNPNNPTLLPITTFSLQDEKDGMIYYGDRMYPGFSKFYRRNHNSKGEKFSPDEEKTADTILLAWKTTGTIQLDGIVKPQYVLVNFFGLRDYPYDGNKLHSRGTYNYGYTIKNIAGTPNIPATKTFSEKILDILSKMYLVQFEKRMFYLGYPNKYVYTEAQNDVVKIALKIATSETYSQLFEFERYNRNSGSYQNLSLNKTTIQNILTNILEMSSLDRNKINYNNIDIKSSNFNLSEIDKTLTYSVGKNIAIEDILTEFLVSRTDLLDQIKDNIIYIDSTDPTNIKFIQNPNDALGYPVDLYKIYTKVDNKFYDLDDTDVKQTFLDVGSTIPESSLFNFTPDNGFVYDYDYYGNYKNIFTTSYANSGYEVGKVNEPLIRSEVIGSVSDSRNSSRYMMWFWSGGGDGEENSWNSNTKGPSVMRTITFDPYYELIKPLKNPLKPKNSI